MDHVAHLNQLFRFKVHTSISDQFFVVLTTGAYSTCCQMQSKSTVLTTNFSNRWLDLLFRRRVYKLRSLCRTVIVSLVVIKVNDLFGSWNYLRQLSWYYLRIESHWTLHLHDFAGK